MAKQFNFVETGQIIPTALHAEMERSYLEYAMSVIVGRALPDVRDGLKPVHRRILYAMHELGLTPDRPFRKCARVVGDVLGKYHPHGDQSVYDALVRMVQDFNSRYPLLAGHGNFGSIDNDPPAAMRYTETRLASIASSAMLQEIALSTVDFTANFDSSQQEPVVLPAQLPILLLNGCTGIAVGMATNIPPHNLRELVDGLIALIDNPELPDEKLWQLIPAPDFPTGGEILATDGIRDAYRTGRGLIPLRGVARIGRITVNGKRRKEKTAIVVSELPYQVHKAAWIEKVAELVNKGRLEGIGDIRDESDRDGMRVVIELKRDADPEIVLAQLYNQTNLQVNFGVIMLALVDNKPCQLALRQLLDEFLKFREQTLRRQYSQELEQCQNRRHLLEGLLAALKDLDGVIEILRHAADGSTAKNILQEKLALSAAQADSILAMPLRRLTGLERKKLETEYEEVGQRIAELEQLLGDRAELMKALKKELRSLKRKFGDSRRTKIVVPKENPAAKTTVKTKSTNSNTNSNRTPPNAVVTITRKGSIYWETNRTEKKQSAAAIQKGEDIVVAEEKIGNNQQLVAITDSGKAYPIEIEDIPQQGKKKKTLLNLLPASVRENEAKIVAHFFTPEAEQFYLILLTAQGRIKRLPLEELANLTNRGMSLIKLKEGDRLRYACLGAVGEFVAIATKVGRVVRFAIDDQQLPLKGRRAQGYEALPLRDNDTIAGCVICEDSADLLLLTELGYGKRLPMAAVRVGNRGDIGSQVLQFTDTRDNLAGMVLAKSPTSVLWTSHERGMRLSINRLSQLGKDGTGDRVIQLRSEEKIVFVL